MNSDTTLHENPHGLQVSSPAPYGIIVHKKTNTIGYSSMDIGGGLKIVNIMDILQDAASEHAFRLGVSGFDLIKEDLAWVIHRYRINILDHPQWQEKIETRTWRCPVKNLYELRQFEITGEDGRPLITAKTAWVMVSKKSKRPVRLSRFMTDEHLTGLQREVKEFPPPSPSAGKTFFTLPFKIRMHDIDLNGHVNNAVYVGWAVETAPGDFLEHHHPRRIDVCFKKESLYGNGVIAKTTREEKNPLETFTTIFLEKTGEELACLNIRWRAVNKETHDPAQ